MNYKRYEECMKKLQEQHPDTGGSAVREVPLPSCPDCRYILDIIVPAYNVEKYADECLRSVLKQKTDYPFRLIAVDDGSTDRTGDLIDRYAGRENVLVIHQKNGGLSAARNTGLEHSGAKYVMFVDSDDCLPGNAVQKLLSAADKTGVDIAAGSYCNFKQFRWLKKKYPQKAGALENVSDLKGHAWGKVLRRSLFEKVRFPEKYWFEDSVMHQIIYPMASGAVGIQDLVYERRINMHSITHSTAGNPKSLDSLWVTLHLMQDRHLLGMEDTDAFLNYLLDQMVLTQKRLRGLDREIQECAFYVMGAQLKEMLSGPEGKNGSSPVEEAVRKMDFQAFLSGIALMNNR